MTYSDADMAIQDDICTRISQPTFSGHAPLFSRRDDRQSLQVTDLGADYLMDPIGWCLPLEQQPPNLQHSLFDPASGIPDSAGFGIGDGSAGKIYGAEQVEAIPFNNEVNADLSRQPTSMANASFPNLSVSNQFDISRQFNMFNPLWPPDFTTYDSCFRYDEGNPASNLWQPAPNRNGTPLASSYTMGQYA